MSLIARTFEQLRSKSKKALIPYLTAGDSAPDVTVPMMHAMVRAGADIIELGVPFSDPMADGPAIQLACERALAHQVGLSDVLHMVAEFRRENSSTPVILMGYLNPVEAMGYQRFIERAADVGVNGVLLVDLPPEEAHALVSLMRPAEIDPIFLVAPTSSEPRIRTIVDHARGFVYYVSLKGVTGAADINIAEVETQMALLRSCTDLPIGIGFGIKDAATAKTMSQLADAVVVGSALVSIIGHCADNTEEMIKQVVALLKSMRESIDQDIGCLDG